MAGGELTRRAVGGILWLSGGKAAYAVLQLLVLAVLARLVSPSEFGVLTAALVVVNFSGIVSQLGMGPALVQRPELEARHIRTAFVVSVALGLVLALGLWLVAPAAADFFHSERVAGVLRALAWIFPLQGLGIVAESLARRELRFRWLAMLDVKAYVVGYGMVGVPLALLGAGVWALVAAEITDIVVRTGILLRDRPPPRRLLPETRALRELFRFGSGLTIGKLANFLALQGDNVVVGRTLGPAALGVYGRAFHLMSAPVVTLGAVLDHALFPTMARVQHDLPRLAAAYRRGVALVTVAVLPASIVLLLLAPEFVGVLLGPQWTDAVLPFQILALGMVLRTAGKMGDALARATGAVYRRAWRQVLYAALVIGGAWVGRRWGVPGVAVAAMLALLVNYILMTHLSLRLTGSDWWTLALAQAPAVALTAILAGVTWLVASVLREHAAGPLGTLLVSSGAAGATALGLARMAPNLFLGQDVLWMIDTLRSMRPRRAAPSVEHPVLELATKPRGEAS
jgi:O-antigen/teichoic acid export membrane protein